MSDQALVIIIVAGIIIAAVAAFALVRAQRRRRLQDWYGPEYERAVETAGSRRAGEAELIERQKRHKSYDIKPLDPGARERYADRWALVQEMFVDDPNAAVSEAAELVTTVMEQRGYPTGLDDDQRIADLSVEHGRTVSEYREAVAISARAANDEASTEDLRIATVHYRALFAELLDSSADELSAVTAGSMYRDPTGLPGSDEDPTYEQPADRPADEYGTPDADSTEAEAAEAADSRDDSDSRDYNGQRDYDTDDVRADVADRVTDDDSDRVTDDDTVGRRRP